MNIAEWSIRKSLIVWVLTLLTVAVGAKSFFQLAWLEDPEFTIKDAIIVTPYPGGSAAEVEAEVTNVIEKAVQELGQLKYVISRSSRGMSEVQVSIKDKYDKQTLPQVWDELRRKVSDAQSKLPPGAARSVVNDDFGDVYGIYVAVVGDGYSAKDLHEVAKFLQRELLLASDVKRVALYGVQPEAVYVEMNRGKMSEFGVSPEEIFAALAAKNLVAPAGHLTIGQEYIPVNPTGAFTSEQQFGELLIHGHGGRDDRLVLLQDVAQIRRGYKDPPDAMLRINGRPAVGVGISTVQGGNVITMGESLKRRLATLKSQLPLGVDLEVISLQSQTVAESVRGFMVSLAEAVAIVVVVLLVFMGLRSGLIIGAVLFVTVMGTFIFMNLWGVTLERISLGALIIALGMLVDNAIVVTDGMRIKIQQGLDATAAAREVVGQTAMPLLAATIIAVLAFAAIGTSQDATGEFCRSLFQVILISLLFSWVTAVTTTPVLCKAFLTPRGGAQVREPGRDPYVGGFYALYRRFLSLSIRFRWFTVLVVAALFAGALVGFGSVKQSFFPDSTRGQFYVDFWFPEGTSIQETQRQLLPVERYLQAKQGVTQIATMVGGGQLRFLLTYTPEKRNNAFAQVVVSVDDYRRIKTLAREVQKELGAMLPQAVVNTRLFVLGPSKGGKIQLRISGPDPQVLRRLADQAEAIMAADPAAMAVRNEWGNMVKVVRPELAEAQARRLGIDRPDLARYMAIAVEGERVGVYRERDELLPIVVRLPESERVDLDNLGAIPVWSPAAQQMIPADQLVRRFATGFENPNLWRRDRTTMLTLHADVSAGLPSEMFARIKAPIEQALGVDVAAKLGVDVEAAQWDARTLAVKDGDVLPLKGLPGYSIAWGGEAEDSARANASIGGYVPIFFGLMVLMVIILFNSIKKTLVIWLTVPMALIGVTLGLLLFDQPFGFMALLGLMSLSGMLIKNAIVLVDQIDAELADGKTPWEAVINSGVSRLIPVSMAAGTTILGMAPLVTDAFFVAMAVTIMFGLGFATVLTLVFVPVLYAIIFRVRHPAG
jgi:multidrug efflux pump subunit AcrB